MKKHLEIYKCRKERAQILFQDGRRSTPKYTIFDYIVENVASYTHSVNKVMLEQGYTIISSDTNSFGGSGATVAVTLIFENTKN